MKKDNGKIKLELKRSTIREAIEMGDMMMASGTLYDEHPIVKLFNEILDEVQTITIKTIERKH
jgi:hypothetical protein